MICAQGSSIQIQISKTNHVLRHQVEPQLKRNHDVSSSVTLHMYLINGHFHSFPNMTEIYGKRMWELSWLILLMP